MDIDDGDESVRYGRKDILPPPAYAELSDLFGPLETFAQSCRSVETEHFLQKAIKPSLAAYASTKTRQRQIRENST